MKIVKAEITCEGCPTQWDAWTDTGQYVYLRYRFGKGTVEIQPDVDPDTWWAKPPERSFTWCDCGWEHKSGDQCWSGLISLDEFCKQASITLELTEPPGIAGFARGIGAVIDKQLSELNRRNVESGD